MFIETHNSNRDETIKLTFVKSSEIQAYPCGRRRSSFVNYDTDGDGSLGEYEGYRIPFDPEARLNTEANNRKQSSLNGFTQTYLADWDTSNNCLSMALGGYLFKLSLPSGENGYVTETAGRFAFNAPAFGSKILTQIGDVTATKIYANIVIEDVHLFSSEFREYYTGILRDQPSVDRIPSTSIDVLASTVDVDDYDAAREPSNYYFAGLSFSTAPLTGNVSDVRSSLPLIVERKNMPEDSTSQLIISLCILERADIESDWQICQPALLPKIEHGVTENSLVIGDTRVQRIEDPDTEEVVDNYNGDLTVDHDIYVGNQLISTGNITTDTLDVLTKTTTKDLDVTRNANINKLVTPDATVTGTLLVHNATSNNATATIDKAVITTAEVDTADIEYADIADTDIAYADIDTADIGIATITTADINTAEIDEVTVHDKTVITGTVQVTNNSTDDATITNATVTDTLDIAKALNVTNTSSNALATVDKLKSNVEIIANIIGKPSDKVNNITSAAATIDTLTSTTANIVTVNSTNINNSNNIATSTETVSSTLTVKNNDGTAQANIDKAAISYANIADTDIGTADIDTAYIDNATVNETLTVLDELRVQNTDKDAELFADKATITDATITNKITTKDLESTNLILANKVGTTTNKVKKLIVAEGTIDTFGSTDATVTGTLKVQKAKSTDTDAVATIDKAVITTAEVTTADIATANITTGNVGTDNITKANITTADITGATIGTETVGTSTITTAGITTATIGTADITTATIDTATIGTATITDTTTDNLTVNTKATIAEADIETADINTLTGNTATVTTIKSDDINQKVNGQYYDVPVMFLDKDGGEYKLRISRVNKTF